MLKILQLNEVSEKEILQRETPMAKVEDQVRDILQRVRQEGDAALLDYTMRFDGYRPEYLELTAEDMEIALQGIDSNFLEILERAAKNIRAYHSKQVRQGFVMKPQKGVILGQRIHALEKVGIYVPGGTAAYPSTVLMNAIPADIAGCREIIMVTPPGKDGRVNPVILAAAKVAGVKRIFRVGGAQAIAALAYGTESVPQVDKIVGPGNAYVAEAKKQVFGRVSIDMVAGPSEILIVADRTANPRYVVADMLAQAEHDRNAAAILLTDSEAFAQEVVAELERQVALLPREEIARASLENNGKILVCGNVDEAIDLANSIAPEHLELCLENAMDYLGAVRNAASVFVGNYTPEALGDYWAGTNHTLPTGGNARFSSPLSVDDFIKTSQFTCYSREALAKVSDDIAVFAEREGLGAHAQSVRVRREGCEQ